MTNKNWSPYFELLRSSEALGLGYTEVGPAGVAPISGFLGAELREHYADLIGLGAFIFRKQTDLTRTWYARTCKLGSGPSFKRTEKVTAQTPSTLCRTERS